MESSVTSKFEPAVSFQSRAKQIRTRKQQQQLEIREREMLQATQGLDRTTYWNRFVKTQEDVIKFYQLYYPEYPPELCSAIASRLQDVLVKVNNGQQLTKCEKQMFQKRESQTWDPLAELNQQKLQGQIELTTKRLDDLMPQDKPDKAK